MNDLCATEVVITVLLDSTKYTDNCNGRDPIKHSLSLVATRAEFVAVGPPRQFQVGLARALQRADR